MPDQQLLQKCRREGDDSPLRFAKYRVMLTTIWKEFTQVSIDDVPPCIDSARPPSTVLTCVAAEAGEESDWNRQSDTFFGKWDVWEPKVFVLLEQQGVCLELPTIRMSFVFHNHGAREVSLATDFSAVTSRPITFVVRAPRKLLTQS